MRGDAAKLVWKPAEAATGYHVQAAAAQDFTERLVDTKVGTVTSLVVRSVLHGGSGTVFWRVASIGPGGRGAFSEAAEFFSSPAPAEGPNAGLTAEAGAETGREGTDHDPSPTHGRRIGSARLGIAIALLFIVLLVLTFVFIFKPIRGGDAPGPLPDSMTTAPGDR